MSDLPPISDGLVLLTKCGEVLPLGPSNDTPWVRWEVLAADVATTDGESAPDCLNFGEFVEFWGGYADLGADDGFVPSDAYLAGQLARCIVEHDKDDERGT